MLLEIDKPIKALGFFTVDPQLDLLKAVKSFANIELMVGLVFSVITLLFASIATLLIYSLLMITTETKRFENGLMSVVGLSKRSYVLMILF